MTDEITLKEGTLRHLQDYIGRKISLWGFDDENIHERLLLLAEEVGELIKSCRKRTGMNTDQTRENKDDIGGEIADIINMTFAVAIKLGIDVEQELLKKHKVIDERVYKRA